MERSLIFSSISSQIFLDSIIRIVDCQISEFHSDLFFIFKQ